MGVRDTNPKCRLQDSMDMQAVFDEIMEQFVEDVSDEESQPDAHPTSSASPDKIKASSLCIRACRRSRAEILMWACL